MTDTIPQEMRAVCLKADGGLQVKMIPVPIPGAGQVLVKISAAPINPSDLARIKHLPEAEKSSFIAGIEGSGVVVAGGKGIIPALWKGKRVACSSAYTYSGTWAEYMVTPAMSCIPLPDEISDEQGAMLLVNPLTAVAFIQIARKKGHKAIINTAAASALGRMLEYLSDKAGLPLIQVVRRDDQAQKLLKSGAKYVLSSTATDFESSLKQMAGELNATLALDAIGGEMTRILLEAVPFGGNVMVYGNLSGEDPHSHHRALVSENKSISGFYLVNWLREQGILTTLKSISKARKLIRNHVTITISSKKPLEQVEPAIEGYLQAMTAGKILLIP
ncbi:MAG TPA: zinc-binding dehydrogenase [Bacteroidales bacterium]|nr:zinc-binding dehydrogenase [Bacteroidales bacterium]